MQEVVLIDDKVLGGVCVQLAMFFGLPVIHLVRGNSSSSFFPSPKFEKCSKLSSSAKWLGFYYMFSLDDLNKM